MGRRWAGGAAGVGGVNGTGGGGVDSLGGAGKGRKGVGGCCLILRGVMSGARVGLNSCAKGEWGGRCSFGGGSGEGGEGGTEEGDAKGGGGLLGCGVRVKEQTKKKKGVRGNDR